MKICNGTYSVYIHHFPNGKMYVGITHQVPEKRWQRNGKGYQQQSVMRKAIEKYGWENITHEIFASHLTKDEACNMERLLIETLDLTNHEYGYNTKPGGLIESEFFDLEDDVMRLWFQGLSVEQIAEKLTCSVDSVHVWLIRNFVLDGEIDESTRQGKQLLRKQYLNTRHTDIFMRATLGWEEGLSVIEISKRWGIARSTISKVLHSFGITKEEICGRYNDKRRQPGRCIFGEKKTLQYSKQGDFIAEYYSAGEAGRVTGVRHISICRACRGERKTAGGYVWKYADDSTS